MSFIKDFDHLKIQMEDVLLATNNFDPTRVIGRGGFGIVYKGELPSPKGQITYAFKRLDRRLGQGGIEFWKEIMMLSTYEHKNLISLKHFCIEGDEMILVYEYASRGSLDRYLSDASTLTWIQRLKICVEAARGLCFLHDPKETQQRVLHRDVKSANILLDQNWTAKVSDFGLSKSGPANQVHSYLFSHAVGTPGYCDPLYMEFGFLSKESDVYSFGVVLFEILCGRLCYEYHNHELTKILVPKWRKCYEDKRLDKIVLSGLREQMDPGSLRIFSTIAYRCVNKAREERPPMAEIVEKLEFSLEQENYRRRMVYSEPAPLSDGNDSYDSEEPVWQLGLGGGSDSLPQRPDEADCVYYLRTGSCGYGSRCRFNHPVDLGGSLFGGVRSGGGEYPERIGEPVCQYYMRTGMCKFGASCKYHHPRRAGSSSTVPLNVSRYPLRPDRVEILDKWGFHQNF
ncbi:putative protein kinase RLK-Pelle-CrRLK1L-1 family transcription factor C3H family [Helianthus annuus]|uniref:Putative zinc finger, CCCH-type n=1 Tax=Helianthus annuus TaxID=4232 RepID=A0A251SVE5_HELAN|nr:probable receptor-like protein kinase At2g23200 [Helianthus annuus]KAF5774511.1 putative protein kinase RLK-Pelle-CrRLK1L-1 family transcription factor C3H family [Helianthus annuus]KAJ0477859.1 putative protein kinase RLK-Pelle-CrRLK1L-1 family transcription factor C3H family [Helianthus annuus]KAJ0482451.1 putative protein kinase RLK-Pelle-CrRLK1L-1 family transcription factor C3H family [Helianthus annuus]KAJ0498687.1 putative protein kinase RLK-Pelle-CrRLK1L-1 family transcription factor